MHGECIALDPVLLCRATTEAALVRSLELRCVIPTWVAEQPAAAEWLARLESLGASVRFLPNVPQSVMLFDHHTALVALPRPAGSAHQDVSIVEGPHLLEALGAFCEFTWDRAEPARPDDDHDLGRLSRQELGVLRLLAEGHTDQVVARRIGVSVRTAGRLTATLMNRLDARSRFQAGARAVQLGLLPPAGEPEGCCHDVRHHASQYA